MYVLLLCIGVIGLVDCRHQTPYENLEDVNILNHNRYEVREYILEKDTEIALAEDIPIFSLHNILSEMDRRKNSSSLEISSNQTAHQLSYSRGVKKANKHEEEYITYEDKIYDENKPKTTDHFRDSSPPLKSTIKDNEVMEKPTFSIKTERSISTTHEPRKRSTDLPMSVFDLGKENSSEQIHHEGVSITKPDDSNASNVTKSSNTSDNTVATSLTSINTSPIQADLEESLVFQQSRDDSDSEEFSEKVTKSQEDFHLQHSSNDQNIVVYQPDPENLPDPDHGLPPTPHITKIPILVPNESPHAVYSADMYEDSRILRFFRGGPPAEHQPILHYVEHSLRHPTPDYDIQDYPDISLHFPGDSPPYPPIDPMHFDRMSLHLPDVISHHNADNFGPPLTQK